MKQLQILVSFYLVAAATQVSGSAYMGAFSKFAGPKLTALGIPLPNQTPSQQAVNVAQDPSILTSPQAPQVASQAGSAFTGAFSNLVGQLNSKVPFTTNFTNKAFEKFGIPLPNQTQSQQAAIAAQQSSVLTPPQAQQAFASPAPQDPQAPQGYPQASQGYPQAQQAFALPSPQDPQGYPQAPQGYPQAQQNIPQAQQNIPQAQAPPAQ